MKREIKFRGLYKGVLVCGNLIQGRFDGVSFTQIENSNSSDFAQWEVDPETVGQYIGLKDKKGVEIYEGDIYSLFGFNYKIVFDNGAFCITSTKRHSTTPINWKPETEDDCMIENFARTIEIIGNIHQNPELL